MSLFARSAPDSRDRLDRLVLMYDRLRARYRPSLPETGEASNVAALLAEADLRAVGSAVVENAAAGRFVAALAGGTALPEAAVTAVRDLLDGGNDRMARSFAQVLQRYDGLRPAGDVCLALVTLRDPMLSTAWALLRRNDPALVHRLAPAEYLRLGFALEPDTARDALAAALDGALPISADAAGWLDIARSSFVAGHEEMSARALDRAAELVETATASQTREGIAELRRWYGCRDAAAGPVELPPGAIPFAVVDLDRPDGTVRKAGEDSAARAVLTRLAGRAGLRVDGGGGSGAAAGSGDRTVRVFPVHRDASDYSAVPVGTWLLVTGRFFAPPLGSLAPLPMNPRLRPLFVSIAIDSPRVLTVDAVAYLQRYAPIGCRDHDTVALLLAAGVPALLVGPVIPTTALMPAALRRGAERVRAVVMPTANRRGSVPVDVLAAALGKIAAGNAEDQVYTAWREGCAPAVAAARAELAAVGEMDAPRVDVAAACAAVRAEAVTVERTEPGPDGPELALEFSLDGNFKHQLDVVLDSIVTHASRPVRAYVLCRGHGAADFDRMARLFPTVSFVWLPTDGVDYGPIAGMLRHITVATMDRLLLPELLPEVDRILHHDLDALCLGDLAELYDIELGDAPVAARDQEHPFGSGFTSLAATRRHQPDPARAREFTLRTHARLAFDFTLFNAGVMVLNLARMRADAFCRHFLPYVERFGLNDQAVLNIYAGRERVPIEAKWNRYPRYEIVDDARILHWLGPMKPWEGPYVQGRPQWRAAEARTAQRIRERLGRVQP